MKKKNMITNEATVYQVMEDILLSYMQKQDQVTDEQWMSDILKCYFPDASIKEINSISKSILYEMDRTNESWNNMLVSEKEGYNAQVWLFHEIRGSMRENANRECLAELSLQNVSMERLNTKVAQEIFRLNSATAQNIYGKRNGNRDDTDLAYFHDVSLQRLHRIIIEEYEALIKARVNPLLMKQEDLNQLAYYFSKNSTAMGITNMIFMTEFFLAKNLQRNSVQEENRIRVGNLVEFGIKNGIDFGIRNAVATALRISSECGLIPLLMKGTPTEIFAGIAFVAVESSKIFLQYNKGEITGWEVFNQTNKIMAAGVCSTILDSKGCVLGGKVGASIGTMVMPGVGTTVGGIGGIVGGFICCSLGQKVTPYLYDQVIRIEGNLVNILRANFHANERTSFISEINYIKNTIQRSVQV